MSKWAGTDDVIRNLEKWQTKKVKELERISKSQIAPKLTQHAKANRPWTDRTGNARRSLHGEVVVTAKDLAIQVHHGVSYGVYLELMQAGKYAILAPTLEENRQWIKSTLQRTIDK